jgi:hypothetical protein
MVKIKILVNFGPLDIAPRRVPVSDILWVFIADVSHNRMTLGQFKVILCVLNGWNLPHRIDLFKLLRPHLKFSDSDLFDFIGAFGYHTQRPNSPRWLGHIIHVQFNRH